MSPGKARMAPGSKATRARSGVRSRDKDGQLVAVKQGRFTEPILIFQDHKQQMKDGLFSQKFS